MTEQDIIKAVCLVHNIGIGDIYQKTRKRRIVDARQMATFIIYRGVRRTSIIEVGRLFGQDHTTILHSMTCVRNLLANDSEYRDMFYKVVNMLGINYDIVNQKIGEAILIEEAKTYHVDVNTDYDGYVVLTQETSVIVMKVEEFNLIHANITLQSLTA